MMKNDKFVKALNKYLEEEAGILRNEKSQTFELQKECWNFSAAFIDGGVLAFLAFLVSTSMWSLLNCSLWFIFISTAAGFAGGFMVGLNDVSFGWRTVGTFRIKKL